MSQEILKTEKAITLVKETFATELSRQLKLVKVSSPIAVLDGTGINDDLNGIERPVTFPVKSLKDMRAVVVHSLAKWKRLRLMQLGMEPDSGILTDMKALRPDEDFTALHSIYVDQWDWGAENFTGGQNARPVLRKPSKKYMPHSKIRKRWSICIILILSLFFLQI